MTNEDIAIPRVQRADAPNVRPMSPGPNGDRQPAPRTSLEADRVGLLAGPAAPIDPDRRIEEWIASNLDLDFQSPPAQRSAWNRIIDNLPGLKRAPNPRRPEQAVEASFDSWARFRVAYKRGITVVRLVDKALVKESRIRELACDLLDLIAAGNHRIVLNFQVTERLASWVVIVVNEARRRCAAADGGALKICGLPRPLASIFPIAGVAVGIDLYDDETAAVNSQWPELSGPRPLPIEILTALTKAADIPPIRGGSPSEAAGVARSAAPRPDPLFEHTAPTPTAEGGLEVSLRVQVGGAKGRAVAVSGSRFVIGRDRNCQLRLGSAMVSKLHAVIERRPGGIFLRDLGSTNGTIVNGRSLRSDEAEVKDGDRIQIGPVISTLMVGPCRTAVGKVDEMVAGWLQGEGTVARPYHGEAQPTISYPTSEDPEAEPEHRIMCEVIQDVLVITPQVSELEEDNVIELLRSHFHALYEQPMPRQVVINFQYIRYVSAHAIGVLLAHHLRLDRAGGAMRICQAHARVMAILHQVQLTMLVECHPTLDEAVLGAWPCAEKRSALQD
ncbi:MAG: FHA domain-containing protein [Isosphaerales bacterium]